MPIGVKTTFGCIIAQKKMQHFVMYLWYQIKKNHNRFSSYKELTFIETRFRNWKKCPKAFIDHATFEYHLDNVLLLSEEEKTGDVSELISTEHKTQKSHNRQVLLQVSTFSFYFAKA